MPWVESVSLARGLTLAVGVAWTGILVAQAQQPAAVAVDADDIGGVVTGAKGPEAGVWVIAETGTADSIREDRRHRRSRPVPDPGPAEGELRRLGPRLRPRRFREGQGHARPHPGLDRESRAEPARRRAVLPRRLLGVDDQLPRHERVPRQGRQRRRRDGHEPGSVRLPREVGRHLGSCFTCHQFGDKATRETPKSLGTFANSHDAWLRRIQSGQVGRRHGEDVQHARHPARPSRCSQTGRTGSPRASCRRRRRDRRASSGTSSSRNGTGGRQDISPRLAVTDRRNPTVNANGPVYGRPR